MPPTKADYLPIKLVNIEATQAAWMAIQTAGQTVDEFLQRHAAGDWGNLIDDDLEFYDRALIQRSTIFSEFLTDNFDRIHIYTAIGRFTRLYLPAES